MIPVTVRVRERGPIRRGLKKQHRQSAKKAWLEAGIWFVRMYADNRFTHSHARKAGYAERKRSYIARKVKRHGHSRPLEYSGRARLGSRTFRATSTSEQVRLKYPGLRVFNFKHPNSQVNMREEWETLLPEEMVRVGQKYDRVYDDDFNRGQGQLFTETNE